ncbi:MAG: hypothetical protein NTW12_14695 [Deltaproteobacteria bacterium]|nr:hypothetical protein [Deltaproteobacteria bacterium]
MIKRIILSIPFLFLVELILGGPGFWKITEAITVRKILFIFSFIILYSYAFIRGRWRITIFDFGLLIFIFANILIWIFWIPIIHNTELSWAFGDGGSIFMLLLYFPLVALMRTANINWGIVRVIFVVLAFIVALIHVAIWAVVYILPDFGTTMGMIAKIFFCAEDYRGIYIGYMPDGYYRVMWISSLYLIPALFIALQLVRRNQLYFIVIFFILFAIIFTYTRSFWLGVAIGFLSLSMIPLVRLANSCCVGRISFSGPSIAFSSFFILMGVILLFWNYDPIAPIFSRFFSLFAGDEGVQIRLNQSQALMETWSNYPLFGTGFGGVAKHLIRSESAAFSYEMFLPMLLMKIGLCGIFLWAVTVFNLFFNAWRIAKMTKGSHWLRYWLASWLAFIIPCMTNPYLFNFVGMSIVLFLLLEMEWQKLAKLAEKQKLHECTNIPLDASQQPAISL